MTEEPNRPTQHLRLMNLELKRASRDLSPELVAKLKDAPDLKTCLALARAFDLHEPTFLTSAFLHRTPDLIELLKHR